MFEWIKRLFGNGPAKAAPIHLAKPPGRDVDADMEAMLARHQRRIDALNGAHQERRRPAITEIPIPPPRPVRRHESQNTSSAPQPVAESVMLLVTTPSYSITSIRDDDTPSRSCSPSSYGDSGSYSSPSSSSSDSSSCSASGGDY